MNNIFFQTINWDNIPKVEYPGEIGTSHWQTMQFESLRIRVVTYSDPYLADHWCQKGHIVHCLEGEFVSELNTGTKFALKKGDSYIVSDDVSSHRSETKNGAKLLIIDGNFLSTKI